jgi:hypothetical protein
LLREATRLLCLKAGFDPDERIGLPEDMIGQYAKPGDRDYADNFGHVLTTVQSDPRWRT